MKAKVFYHAAIYLRLSRDDENMIASQKTMSNSITSQKDLICSFLKEQEDMELFDTYIDDGYSGTHFNRPDFKRMMADIERGQVNCVIVKDLSRLGRDYIEAGRFLQKIFPAFSVRFIAITDHYDSIRTDRNTASLMIPVKNFVNDSYCRDISSKVKGSQKVKREQGKFIGAFAVYGYCKNPANKNQLIPDYYAAEIVKNIFTWRLDGMSNLAISNRLNDLGIFSPLEYKKLHEAHYTTGFQTNLISKWSPVAVKRILTNEIYTGTMVQGKREKINYKIQKLTEKPESEWIRVPDTHEAIISTEDFQNVQKLLQIDTRAEKGKNKAHLFSGLLFCGDCKNVMAHRIYRYKGTEHVHYICSTRNRSAGCTRHRISETVLSSLVRIILQTQTAIFVASTQQPLPIQEPDTDQKSHLEKRTRFDQEIACLRNEQRKYRKLQTDLYEDLKMNIITPSDFKSFHEIYEKQCQKIQLSLAKQEAMTKQWFHADAKKPFPLDQPNNHMQLTELNRHMLLTFIDKIEIYENNRIHIKFRSRQEFF